jgi:hypothetical protein
MAASDEIARMRAEMDQGREGAKELARTLGGFYKECRSSGSSRGQALELTKLWFTSLLGSASAAGMLEQILNGGEEES